MDFRHQFVDYAAGLLFYGRSVWLGVSAHHLSQPNTSFLDDEISQLPMKISAHGGVKVDLVNSNNPWNSSRELILAFNYKNQGPFQQMDLGTQLYILPLVVGLWYRGIPIKGMENPSHESIITLIGVSLSYGLDVGYSYDFSVSSLGNANTAGAHEISIRYTFPSEFSSQARMKTSMPCFKY